MSKKNRCYVSRCNRDGAWHCRKCGRLACGHHCFAKDHVGMQTVANAKPGDIVGDCTCGNCRLNSEESVVGAISKIQTRYERAEQEAQRCRPVPGTIQTGSAYVRAQATASALRTFLRSVKDGNSSHEALTAARKDYAAWAEKWNAVREVQVHIPIPTADESAPEFLWWALRLCLNEKDQS